jgi:eukaryotic-like serine/threonine-protein kinase
MDDAMDELTNRAEEIFCAALQMPPERRGDYLTQACADSPVLRAKVEKMLSRHSPASEFFQNSQPEIDVAELASELAARTLPDDMEVEKQVGPYHLIERLGEGGNGIVYLAEQQKPVRRQVALKILRLGMDTKSFIARFKAESHALAMMDHPGIARVLDAGATEKGRPYFVMELVRGVKITEYCDANRYCLRQRQELFVKACQAIQHAHQKGIIHRDIKPSNVLVMVIDGVAVPKVIDFGIAKAVSGGNLTDLTVFITCERLIGTPAYMSPEQAQMSGIDVDTRSDVYSLGVLLYELLTGKTPFEQKELVHVGFDEMRRKLREQDPPLPSAKLGAMPPEELTQAAVQRRVEPARFKALLTGDLDWIVMKALDKDRNRRYQTALGLGMDVQRHLDNDPVFARPPSRVYQLRKLVRRNRALFVSMAAVSLALAAGFGTSTWLFLKERKALVQVQKARETDALLRRQAEAQLIVAKAASLLDKYQMPQADELVGQLPLTDMATMGAPLFRALGDWAAVNGKWRRAAEYYSALVRLDLEQSDPTTLDYTKYAVALVELGDRPAYDNFCREYIKHFAETDDVVAADRIIKLAALYPPDDRLLAEMAHFGELTKNSLIAVVPQSQADWPVFWRYLSLALYEYRRGDYPEAIKWSNRCFEFDHLEPMPPRLASAHAISAMCLLQVGQRGQASLELAKSRELIEGRSKTPFLAYDDGRGWWYDWLLGRILEREAAARIEAPSAAKE